MWLNQFKIAIIEKNTDKLNELMENLPELTKQEEIEEAVYLLKEAVNLITNIKDKTQASMIQMKKNITFLKVTETRKPSKLDIKS